MPEGPLRLALETKIASLDPADASDAATRRITSQIFDTVLAWDIDVADDPLALRPALLAEPPTIGADGSTMTLRLTTGEAARRFAPDTCLEGQARPVRASDVAASLQRIDPARHPAWALLAGRIVGLDEFHRDRSVAPAIVADDAAGTVTLGLTRPQPELPAILASPMLAIVPPECLAYYDGRDAAHPPFARHPVGSGPYVVDHARTELPRGVVLVPSPTAPARPGDCVSGPIALTHFSDPEPALRSFQAGELAALVPGQSQFAEVFDPATGELRPGATPAGTRVLRFPTASTTLLVFRMRDAELGQHEDPETDRRHRALRQAIALVFDGVRYQRVVRNDAWAVQRARIVPRPIGDDAALHRFAPPAADVAQARQILAAAGVTPPPTLRYHTEPGEAQQQEAEILRDAVRALDIDLQITRRPGYLGDILADRSDAQLYSLRYDADYLDPASFLAPFTCAAADNFSGYCDPTYDAAFAGFTAAPAGPARDRGAAALEAILGEAVPARPIDQPSAWYLLQPWLRDVRRHPITGLHIASLCPRTAAAVP